MSDAIGQQMAMLSPKTIRLDIGRGGGVPEFTAENVCGAMAGMSPVESAIFLSKYRPDLLTKSAKIDLQLYMVGKIAAEHRRLAQVRDEAADTLLIAQIKFASSSQHQNQISLGMKLTREAEAAKLRAWPKVSAPKLVGIADYSVSIACGIRSKDTDEARAKAIGISRKSIIKSTWNRAFDFSIDVAREILDRAVSNYRARAFDRD